MTQVKKRKVMSQKEINFACESITELLDCAEEMLTLKKPASTGGNQQSEKGIYGLSITILIACAFDAMGKIGLHFNHVIGGENKKRFKHIQDNYVNDNGYGFSNDQFVDIFYGIYRNDLVHSGYLTVDYSLKNNEAVNIVYDDTKKDIYVQALVQMAKEIFEKLKKAHSLSSSLSHYLNDTVTGMTQSAPQVSQS